MPKKKVIESTSKPVTTENARERTIRAADEAWDRSQAEANKNYDNAMYSAWHRYNTALKAHGKAKSAGTSFDKQYDKERETALKVWKESSEKADKALTLALLSPPRY